MTAGQIRLHKNVQNRRYYAANLKTSRARSRRYQQKNKEKVRDRHREYQRANPEKRRGYKLKYRYNGFTHEDYARLLTAQGGHCVFCSWTQGLVVDHDHITGAVRGLLCRAHNRSLAHFGDNEEGLLQVLAYLRGTPSGG